MAQSRWRLLGFDCLLCAPEWVSSYSGDPLSPLAPKLLLKEERCGFREERIPSAAHAWPSLGVGQQAGLNAWRSDLHPGAAFVQGSPEACLCVSIFVFCTALPEEVRCLRTSSCFE